MRTNVAILLAATASLAINSITFAADMPVRAPSYTTAPITYIGYQWTGCYIGANAGGLLVRSTTTTNTFSPPAGVSAGSHNADGAMVGGQLGCNYQMGMWVVGVEGMGDWVNPHGSHITPTNGTAATNFNWLGTATGRVGYIFDRSVLYVEAGGAWLNGSYSIQPVGGVLAQYSNLTKSGWTVGTGLETAIGVNWTIKIEYDYLDFGTTTPTLCTSGVCATSGLDFKQNAHAVLLGINYRFLP